MHCGRTILQLCRRTVGGSSCKGNRIVHHQRSRGAEYLDLLYGFQPCVRDATRYEDVPVLG